MGCGLSTKHISLALKRKSVKELPESPNKLNLEMESSEPAHLQNLGKSVIDENIDFHESSKNSSPSHHTEDFVKSKKLSCEQHDNEKNLAGEFNRDVPTFESALTESEVKVEILINGHPESRLCHGKDRMESNDQDAQENKNVVTFKLISEEINKTKNETLRQLEDILQKMTASPFRDLDQDGAPFTKEFRQGILQLAKSYFHFKVNEMPYSMICEYRREIGQALNMNGAIKLMCDVLSDGLKRMDFMDSNRKMVNEYWFPIKNIILTLLNFSDSDLQVRLSVTDHPDAIQLLVQLLRDWQTEHLSQELTEDQDKLLKWSLSILHNCASSDDNVARLRDLGVMKVVLPYVDSKNENIRLSSISVVALLANDKEAELLVTRVSLFQFMIRKLGKALKKVDRKDLGWSAAELTTAIGKLARNDANKKVLVQEGCLPLLVEQLHTGGEKEIKEAVNCLWTLSFDDGNKWKMVNEPELVKIIYEKYLILDSLWRHDCQGVLWSLREQLLKLPEYRIIGEEISSTKDKATGNLKTSSISNVSIDVSGSPKVKGHVMISYQWANQEVIKQICHTLRCNGIPVWIDIDYMGGSTLQAMAKAVENSVAVIIAMSQKYKDSPNTRAEAEYTFQQRKAIIPLIMQRGYQPDGWLGLILGTKFYYDFSGKYTFQSRMDSLLVAVKAVFDAANKGSGDRLEVTTQLNLASPMTTEKSNSYLAHISKIDEQAVMMWTSEDIRKWLTKYNLENSALLKLLPEEILFLHNLRSEAPEFFYHCLESKLKLTTLLDLGRAARALANVTS